MIKVNVKAPTKRELIKCVTAAAEKQIAERARKAAAPHGGVRVRFTRKADGSLGAVHFEGTDRAVEAARKVLGS